MKKAQGASDVKDISRYALLGIISDSEHMSEIIGYNRRYLHWDELRHEAEGDRAVNTWAVMKYLRNSTINVVHVCGLDLKYNVLPDFQEQLHNLDRDPITSVVFDATGDMDMRRYAISSLMEEAIASSQIDGASTIRQNAKKMLRAQKKPKNIDERMICNNYLVMENIKDTIREKMDIDLITDLHRIITKDALCEGPEWEGRFREDDDVVTGGTSKVFHTHPEHHRIPGLMQDLCDFINDSRGEFIHPVIKGIMIHYLVGYIHPFVDGNGRLARSLYYWYVLKNGYCYMEYVSISRAIKESQTRYRLAYQYSETDDNDLTYFIKFNLDCISSAVDDFKDYVKRKTMEQSSIIQTIEFDVELNRNEIMILEDYSSDMSTFTVKELSSRYPISYQTARNYVGHLCGLGYIGPVSRDRKEIIYSVLKRDEMQSGQGPVSDVRGR